MTFVSKDIQGVNLKGTRRKNVNGGEGTFSSLCVCFGKFLKRHANHTWMSLQLGNVKALVNVP